MGIKIPLLLIWGGHIWNSEQEGHDGPEIAHLFIVTLHDKEKVEYWIINKSKYKI
jgi:hypothetical protein